MKILLQAFVLFTFISVHTVYGQSKPVSFNIVPLGVKGGSDESNLSCYMIAPAGSNKYVCLDAGTINAGIQAAVDAKIFRAKPSYVLKNYIKGYLISHAHLDHTAGLIINSPDDTTKNIYGLPSCLDILKEKYFTWKSWANFADEGDKPLLKKYHYTVLEPAVETDIANTNMNVKAFRLSHVNPYESTAFLIRTDSSYVLYLGDTGADEVEKSNNLHKLWQEIAPLIVTKKLKGIFIEVSFSNKQPVKQLFGHLTPQLLMQEMDALSKLTGTEALKGFTVLITHIKPIENQEIVIREQLKQSNKLQLKLVFPQQAKAIRL
ncbi:MAG TPA: 3',5'-cyclic-nucleotide phosphodiesterase [Segetibacter sp.]|jgi:3',5'-cyclic-nucleotide phosphodiesterase